MGFFHTSFFYRPVTRKPLQHQMQEETSSNTLTPSFCVRQSSFRAIDQPFSASTFVSSERNYTDFTKSKIFK